LLELGPFAFFYPAPFAAHSWPGGKFFVFIPGLPRLLP
jgi:hypothetical protein